MATTAPSGNITLPNGSPQIPGTTTNPVNGTAAQIGDADAGVVSADIGFGDIDPIEATPVFWPVPLRTYDRVSATKSMGGIPRFGHTSDFSYVAYLGSGPYAADGDDYIIGLVFAGCFLFMFFLTWSIVLLVFKIGLTGFLSGEPFINPHLTDPVSLKEKEEMELDGEEYVEDTNWLKRPRRIRIAFFLCGLLQIIFAILMVTHGVKNLQQSTDSLQLSSHSIRLLVNEAEEAASDIELVAKTSTILRDQIVFDLNTETFCPANPAYAETLAGQNIVAAAGGAIKVLNDMGDFVSGNVALLEESLASAKRNLDSVDQSLENVESLEWLGGLVAFPFLILSTLMLVGVGTAQLNAMSDCFLCVLNWVILPLYIFLTVLSYVSLAIIAIAASANADFCGGESSTPDQVLIDLMVRSGFTQEDLFFQTVRYYAYQCTARAETDPFLFLRTFSELIVQGGEVVQNVTDNMDRISLEQLSLGCNRDFHPLHRALGQMIGVLDALVQSANGVLKLFRCQMVVPIYTETSYDAVCTYSISGFAWIFSCLLILSAMGHILIMFRSSYQNTVFDTKKHVLLDDSSGLIHSRTAPQTKRAKGKDRNEERWNDENEER